MLPFFWLPALHKPVCSSCFFFYVIYLMYIFLTLRNRKETPPPPPPRQTEEVRLVLERPDGMDNDKFGKC
jgi:hypothetical protein